MKKFFTNKLTLLAIAALVTTIAYKAHAAGFFKITAATTPSGMVFSGPGKLNSIQIYNPSTVATTVYFYDSTTTNYTSVIGAYTNYLATTARATNIYTNFFGALNTNIFNYVSNVAQNVASATYTNRIINILVIPATNSVTSTLVSPIMYGLMYTNTVTAGSNLVMTVDINPQQ